MKSNGWARAGKIEREDVCDGSSFFRARALRSALAPSCPSPFEISSIKTRGRDRDMFLEQETLDWQQATRFTFEF